MENGRSTSWTVCRHRTSKAEAAEAYQAALQLDPMMADCHYNLALVCEQLGRAQEAIRHMAQYRKLVAKK